MTENKQPEICECGHKRENHDYPELGSSCFNCKCKKFTPKTPSLQTEEYFTKCIDGTEVRVGSILKFDGKEKKIINIMYINMLVDRFDFDDGTFIFTGDEWEFIK